MGKAKRTKASKQRAAGDSSSGKGGGRGNGGNGPGNGGGRRGNGGDGPGDGDKKKRRNKTREWVKSGVTAVVLWLLIKTFVLQTFVITSGSMKNTLLVGDFLILSKVAYGPLVPFTELRLPGYNHPRRGDVAVFRPPHDPHLDVVKRIIGMPGDTLSMKNKQLYIDGVAVKEPYVRHTDLQGDVGHPWMQWQCGKTVRLSPDISGMYRIAPGTPHDTIGCHPTRDNWGPLVVPSGHVFMMGDNRDDSVDSRYWGYLDMRKLRGRAVVLYYSYNAESLEPFRWITAVRWNRIGHVIRTQNPLADTLAGAPPPPTFQPGVKPALPVPAGHDSSGQPAPVPLQGVGPGATAGIR
ncbi:MAG: signal peptidase I [Gemmatimonadota bacterium]